MAKSVRISDRLYKDADAGSRGMHRSLAQQIEHWAALGRALEAAGVTMPQVLALLGSDLRARERVLLKLGLASPESMYLLPASIVAKTQVHFPELRKKPELQKK